MESSSFREGFASPYLSFLDQKFPSTQKDSDNITIDKLVNQLSHLIGQPTTDRLKQIISFTCESAANTTHDKLAHMITRFEQEKSTKVKLGLFVEKGAQKTISQLNNMIPKENGQQKIMAQSKGWIWFSIDHRKREQDFSYDLHLNINLKDDSEKIQKLFDKVIIGKGVLKSIYRDNQPCVFQSPLIIQEPWNVFHSLLINESDAKLIIEGWSGIAMPTSGRTEVSYDPNRALLTYPASEDAIYHEEVEKAFSRWENKVGKEVRRQEYDFFLKELCIDEKQLFSSLFYAVDQDLLVKFKEYILKKNELQPKKIDYVPELLNQIQQHLETLFNTVTLSPEFSPSTSRDLIHQSRWIASNPKDLPL